MAINIAILGTGSIADGALAPALRNVEGARLWSVLSRNPARGKDFARKHGAAAPQAVYTELDALLADPHLDAVIVATPDKLHAPQAMAAARAGKHVLVEKPMVTSVDEAHALIDACTAAGVHLGVAYHLRWHAGHRALFERAQAGALGDLRHARVHWSFAAADASTWRARDGMGRWWSLGAVGTHAIDLVRWFLLPSCGEVAAVRAVTTHSVWGGPHDESAVVALRFESGATAEIFTSVLFRSTPRFELYGSKSAAICDGTLGPHGRGTIRLGEDALEFAPQDPYAGELTDFVAAIGADRPPEVGGAEGLRNVELLAQIA